MNIGYGRLSVKSDGLLGLDVQKSIIESHFDSQSIVFFQEVASGFDNNRPQFKAATDLALMHDVPVIVSHADRITRDAEYFDRLIASGVRFIVASASLTANELRQEIVFAQREGEIISRRTKDALQELKSQGIPLGSHHPNCPELSPEARRKGQIAGSAATRQNAIDFYESHFPIVRRLRDENATYQAIADELTRRGLPTRRGGQWSASQALRIVRLMEIQHA